MTQTQVTKQEPTNDLTAPEWVLGLLDTLEGAGWEAWLVGGCVRDHLMGIVPHDYDIATNALPRDVAGLFPRVVNTGEGFGGVTVVAAEGAAEVTTYRTEGGYLDGRRPSEVRPAATLREDVLRRDFTIGAICWSPRHGIVDYTGGIEDIRNGVIRAVGDPKRRFAEDHLRILRAVRFAARFGFTIEPATLSAMLECAPGLTRISRERIGREIMGTLTAPDPAKLGLLADAGALAFLGIPAGRDWQKLADAPDGPAARLAALSQLSGACASELKNALKLPNKLGHTAARLCDLALAAPSADAPSVKRAMTRSSPAELITAMRLRAAMTGKKQDNIIQIVEEVEQSHEPYNLSMLAVGGAELLDAGVPEKEIGAVLQHLLGIVIEYPQRNTPPCLMAEARKRNT